MNYQLWCRSTVMNQPDRWHGQWIADSFEKAADLAKQWQRTYPTHEVCILPASGSFPITISDWQLMINPD